MKIAINAIPYTDWQGIETFLAGLLQAWPENETDEITIFANQKSSALLQPLPSHLKIKVINFKKIGRFRLFLYQQFSLILELKKIKADILICPSLMSPWLYQRKLIIVHDLAPFVLKSETGWREKILWQACLWAAKYLSLGIMTVSEFSRQEISRYLKISPDRITNISEACPALPATGEPGDGAVLKKFHLTEKKYFIYIGNVRPRKNLENTLLAWQKFNALNGYQYYFVIAGRGDCRYRALQSWTKERQIPNIIFTDFISTTEKVSLLKKSLGLLFISSYEGFGLPILEAQSLGVPVITANISALPETAGQNGALFTGPLDVQEIADKINQLAHDEPLRQKLIAQGKLNIQKYSWTETARKLMTAIASKKL